MMLVLMARSRECQTFIFAFEHLLMPQLPEGSWDGANASELQWARRWEHCWRSADEPV